MVFVSAGSTPPGVRLPEGFNEEGTAKSKSITGGEGPPICVLSPALKPGLEQQ